MNRALPSSGGGDKTYPLLRRTGQLRSWRLSQCVLWAGMLAVLFSRYLMSDRDVWVRFFVPGLIVMAAGALWLSSIACPKCRASFWFMNSLFFRALTKRPYTMVREMNACPHCHYSATQRPGTSGALANGRKSAGVTAEAIHPR